MLNSDSIREMLLKDYWSQSLLEPSSAIPSLPRHPHHNTWVYDDYSTIYDKQEGSLTSDQYISLII